MRMQLKRLLCLVLCVATLLSLITTSVSAASEDGDMNTGAELLSDSSDKGGMDAVTTTQKVTIDGLDYVIERTTRCIGTRTYSVQIRVKSSVESEDAPVNIASAQNGYVTVTHSGWYLLELWGGDGADGSDNKGMSPENIFLKKDYAGGQGANGGYVYAKIWLDAGQTLVYTIGTNGQQSLASDENAGGENGEGGIHGTGGSKLVGSGGGFSALYFFDKGEFDSNWVTVTGIEIPENARLTKYIMIAGGGGGGGAGAGTDVFAYDDDFAPNGGIGGTITNGVSVTLRGDSYAVEGYIFSGRNGSSSHTSTAYVGIGGTAVPGAVVDTGPGWAEDQRPANDWTGTYSDLSPYGAGGRGNFRGGGGGAGFTGGSGGNMASSIAPTNVGGGGGGSSFIADHVTYKNTSGELSTRSLIYDIDGNDIASAYIMPSNVSDGQRHAGVGIGGACEITYLGNDDELDLNALRNTTVTTTISKYFTVNQAASASTGTLSYSQNASTGVTTVTATGVDITPSSSTTNARVGVVDLVVVAKADFAGGNSVEMVHGALLQLDDPHDTTKRIEVAAEENDSLDFVNVALKFTLNTKSYTTSVVGRTYAVTDFYEDSYASVRNSLSSYWQYDYISSIGQYSVWKGSSQVTGNVSVSTTTTFDVRYDVTLKTVTTSSPVTVGQLNNSPARQSKSAIVSIVSAQTALLSDITTTVSRGLEYRNGQYLFLLNLDQTSQKVVFPLETTAITASGEGHYEVKTNGWYYIQVWGANGQASGSSSIRGNLNYNNVKSSGSGAAGGAGGYVNGYVYLTAGTYIDYVVGAAPAGAPAERINQLDSATGDADFEYGVGGAGGNYSAIMIGGSTYLIAGGGGGAGGSAAAASTGTAKDSANGVTPSANTTITNSSTLFSGDYSAYNGTRGGNGTGNAEYSFWGSTCVANSGSVGKGGSNYRYAPLVDGFDITGSGIAISQEAKNSAAGKTATKSSGTGGQVSISLLESDVAIATRETLTETQVDVAISQYFDVVGVTMQGSGATASYTAEAVSISGGVTATRLSISTSYTATVVEAQDKQSITYKASPTVVITLEPKAGFLGGNDVPVILSGLLGGSAVDANDLPECGVRVTKGDHFMYSPKVNTTDYANVELDFNFDVGVGEEPIFETNDATVMLGESVNESDLYTVRFPSYTGVDSWKADFVTFVEPTDDGDSVLTPTKTTEYTLGVSLRPKKAAELAIIQPSVSSIDYSLTALVYVNVSITYTLDRLTSTGLSVVPHGKEYRVTLVPVSGYLLPDSVRVYSVSGGARTELTGGYSYDTVSGEIILSAGAVVSHLEIEAIAKIRTYSIYVEYATGVGSSQTVKMTFDNGGTGYAPGDAIDVDALLADISYSDVSGYTFAWAYDTDDGTKPTVMPANDLWIFGSYEKNLYMLTVQYQYENGSEAASEVSVAVAFGDTYSIPSPTIKGYKADQPVVTGTQGASAQTVVVVYSPSSNEVILVFLKKDGTEARDSVTDALLTGESKTYQIAQDYPVEGYTPDQSTVSVTMEGDSVTVVVIYIPNTYNVTFEYAYGEFADATLDTSPVKRVEFGNVYSYDATSGTYVGLPTPQIVGHRFDGWYLDGVKITDISTVSRAGDHTLVAKWARQEFKLTIRYNFVYEEGDYLPDGKTLAQVQAELASKESSKMCEYGLSYSIDSIIYTGYTPYVNYNLIGQTPADQVSGIMPAQNLLIIVDYAINVYTIIFKDAPGVGITYSDWNGEGAAPDSVKADAYNTTWATVYVKHNVIPQYPLADVGVPEQNANRTKAGYSYEFLGWLAEDGSKSYDGLTPVFEPALNDGSYYTRFYATENTVGVQVGAGTYYYTTVAEALAFVKTDPSAVTKMLFRRNSHNGTEILLNGDTVLLDSGFTTATGVTLTVDLRGYTLRTTNGQSVVDNQCATALGLTLTDTVGNGAIVAEGSGNVIAVNSASGALTVSATIDVSASSANGDATAVRFLTVSGASYIHSSGAMKLTATAPKGTAIALHLADTQQASDAYTSVSSNHALSATGLVAYGIKSEGMSGFGITSATYNGSITASGVEAAYGVDGVSSLYLASTATVTAEASGSGGVAVGLRDVALYSAGYADPVITVEASQGTAYGMIASGAVILNYGVFNVSGDNAYGIQVPNGASVSLGIVTLNVNGKTLAIGVENQVGGTLTRSGSTGVSTMAVTSTSGNAYGIKNHGTVTTLTAKITADGRLDTYGIYNEGGTLDATGASASIRVLANSSHKNGYGLYSAGGSVGTADNPLNNGAFAGSTYGIYCTDGSITVSGNELFFKGNSKENAIYESTAATGNTLSGVHIVEGYLQVEANTNDPDTGAVGYYRLGRKWTITFVTNGGNEIEEISQIYDTPLTKPADPYKLGYDFMGWYTNEELTSSYTIPSYMPDSDKILYAKWSLITYTYTLDTDATSLQVTFNPSYPVTSGAPSYTTTTFSVPKGVSYGKDSVYLSSKGASWILEDLTYANGKTLYIFKGWYTQSGTYVSLNGDLCVHDTDQDGILTLVGKWQSLSYYGIAFKIPGTGSASTEFSTEYQVNKAYCYMYYVVPEAGNYKLSAGSYHASPADSARKYVQFMKNSSTVGSESLVYAQSTDNKYTVEYSYSNLVAGDVIVMRWRRIGSSTTISKVHGMVTSTTVDNLSQFDNSAFVASNDYRERYTYNVEMGDVSLKIPTKDGYQFIGWSQLETTDDKSQMTLVLTPEMVEIYDAWRDHEILDLYSQWDEVNWDGYWAENRNMLPEHVSTNTPDAVIQSNSTITIRFHYTDEEGTAYDVTDQAVFTFASGLNAGTILTLVDCSTALPTYYTYTVSEDGVSEVTAADFLLMGDKTQSFEGASEHVMLQICYTNSTPSSTQESVGIVVGDLTPEIEISYSLVEIEEETAEQTETVMNYLETREDQVTVPTLSESGFVPTDRIFIRISWGNRTMAPGIQFFIQDYEAKFYGNYGAMIVTDLTVADVTADQTLTLSYRFETMRFMEFEDWEITYEVCVLPDGKYDMSRTLYASDITVIRSAKMLLTVTETPTLSIQSTSPKAYRPGEMLTVDGITCENATEAISVFVYAYDEGTMQFYVSEDCNRLFDSASGYSIAQNGALVYRSESGEDLPLITDGVLEAALSSTAITGRYYLKFVCGDKYVYVPFRIFVDTSTAT